MTGAQKTFTTQGDEEAIYANGLHETYNKPWRRKAPRYKYQEAPNIQYKGRDALGRETTHEYDDRCIDPFSGKFVRFKAQSTDDVLRGSGGATWRRRRIRAVGHWALTLANWAVPGKGDAKLKSVVGFLSYLWKALILVIPMIFLSIFFQPGGGQVVNHGRYSPVPYRYFGRAKKSRNEKDDKIATHSGPGRMGPRLDFNSRDLTPKTAQEENVPHSGQERLERALLPRRLCFLSNHPTRQFDHSSGQTVLQYQSTNIKQWMRENNQSCPEYLFVAFATKQFPTAQDTQRLHELARHATEEAGLPCYWLATNCMANVEGNFPGLVADVWRISDVIRGCKNMVVMLSGDGDPADLLKEWGQSIWTLPELLLSPGKRLTVYHNRGNTPFKQVIPKNQFAARYLATSNDRYQVRRLIDHYLGSLKLSDLELMTVALHCFSSRDAGSEFLPGDYSYALMGLLGHRPQISASDSAFLAFARLSLENYNSRLFKRFVCLLPAEHDQAWHKTQDAYGAQLWDIEPTVQVAGIGVYDENVQDPTEGMYEKEYFLQSDEDDYPQAAADHQSPNAGHSGPINDSSDPVHASETEPITSSHSQLKENDVVILDGCFAATVYWDKLRPVWYAKKLSLKRRTLIWLLKLAFIPLIIGITLLSLIEQVEKKPQYVEEKATVDNWMDVQNRANQEPNNDTADVFKAVGALCIAYCFFVYMAAPVFMVTLYKGKFWDTQPWFFGFEGYMPIEDIETKIFGAPTGRLRWSSYASSTLSQHQVEDNRWLVPCDPCDDPSTAQLVQDARHAKPGDWRIFTIADTYAMTVTLFEARRPPVALLVCGSEGGMQRALGCSFEWTTSTFYKETVLRLETRSLQRMDRITRVRLGIQRQEKPTAPRF